MLIPDIVENPVIQHKWGKIAISGKFAPLISTSSVIHNGGVLTKVKGYVSMQIPPKKSEKPKYLSSHNNSSEEVALDYLASILVGVYLDQRNNEQTGIPKTSSDILPSLNEGTG
jgi:hypothetical protein